MKALKEKLSVTLDSDIITHLRKYAELDDRSLSSFINLILRDYVKNKEKDKGAE